MGVSAEQLRRERELYDFSQQHSRLTVEQIREWCANGELVAHFPTLPELFSSMSDAEIREWCEGSRGLKEYLLDNSGLPDSYWVVPSDEIAESREAGEYHRGPIPPLELPPDPGLKLRQLRSLLAGEREFRIRYPDAYRVLFASPHPESRRDIGGLRLPSFGSHVARNAPRSGVLREEGIPADAYSATPDVPEAERPADQALLPLDLGYLRGLLMAILSREEFLERVSPPDGRSRELLEGVGTPARSLVRLTDLRIAMDLEPGTLNENLRSLLENMRCPITREGVEQWKRDVLQERRNQVGRRIGDLDALTLVVSFAAAALCLFADLDMPGVRNKTSYRLAELVETLADIVRKASSSLDAGAVRLEALGAERAAGGQRRPKGNYLYALRLHRMGRDRRYIAEWWGITPYSSQTGQGSRDWKQKVARILFTGVEAEKEFYPQVAAIFKNRDKRPVLCKALRAYRAIRVEWRTGGIIFGEYSLSRIGATLRINAESERGRQIIMAYIQLGNCLVSGIDPLPEPRVSPKRLRG